MVITFKRIIWKMTCMLINSRDVLVEEKAQIVKSVKFVNSKSSHEGERRFPKGWNAG